MGRQGRGTVQHAHSSACGFVAASTSRVAANDDDKMSARASGGDDRSACYRKRQNEVGGIANGRGRR